MYRRDLNKINIEWKDSATICVILASGGYPGSYKKGYEITGLDDIDRNTTIVFQAGTKLQDGKIVTNGGRVLGVTSIGKDIKEASKIAYNMVDRINFEGKQFRTDIWK